LELARAVDNIKQRSRLIIESIVSGNTDMLRGHLSDMEAMLERELSRVRAMKATEADFVGLMALFG